MMLFLLSTLALAAPRKTVPFIDVAPEPPPAAPPAPVGPDRSKPPAVGPAVLLTLPDPEVHAIRAGVEAWYVRVPGVRHVEVSVIVRTGGVVRPESAALWSATSAVADLGTDSMSPTEVSAAEDLHAMDVYTQLGWHQWVIAFDAVQDDLGDAWTLLDQVIHQAAPPRKDLSRWVRDQVQWLTVEGPASQGTVAEEALRYAWYPKDHPYGERPDLAAFKALKVSAVSALYEDWMQGGPVRVIVVGDVEWSEAEPHVLAAVEGIGVDLPSAAAVAVTPPSKGRVVGVDMPGQKQAALKMRAAAPSFGAEDRVAFWVTNWALGGHFLSRLNTNLREEKGFTYGAGSYYQMDRTWGALTVATDVKVENAGLAIVEIEAELARLVAEGVTAKEVSMAQRSLSADWNNQLQSASSAAGLYAALSYVGETMDQRKLRYAALATLTPEQTRGAAQQWLGPDQARVWVVVGDRKQLAPQLEALGWTVEWTTPQAAVLGQF